MDNTYRHFKDTTRAQLTKYEPQVLELLKFIINNRDGVILPQQSMDSLLSQRSTVQSPISIVYDQLLYTGSIDNFCTLYIDNTKPLNGSMPDILASNSVVIDLKGLSANDVVTSIPEVHNKIITNITQVTKYKQGIFTIPDMVEMQSLFVKGALCRSYNVDELWLSPSISEYLIETYSVSIANKIFSLFSLDLITRSKIMVYLALFMASKLSKLGEDQLNPRILNRCNFLGNAREVREILLQTESMLDERPNRLNVIHLCKLIANSGPERLSGFDLLQFNRIISTLGFNTDPITTQIASEYPPFWCYLIIHALGGSKVFGLIQQLKQNRLLDKGKKFLLELKINDGLYQK